VADRRIVPYFAICSFAGLRSAECENLDWKYIDLDRRIITILENVSKTGEERKPPISDNLAAWLEPYVKAERHHCTVTFSVGRFVESRQAKS
jgi:integrase